MYLVGKVVMRVFKKLVDKISAFRKFHKLDPKSDLLISTFSRNVKTSVEIIIRGGYYEKITFGDINFHLYSEFFRCAK